MNTVVTQSLFGNLFTDLAVDVFVNLISFKAIVVTDVK